MSVRLFPLPTSDAAMRRRMSGAEISFGVGENRRPSKQVCQNGYSEKSTSKTSLARSRIPCKQFVKYRASKRNISPKTGRQSLYTSPILRILSNFVGKDARNKAHKTPDGTALCLRRYRPSASSHRFARCKTDSRRRPSGIAPKLCDSFARQAGGRSPSKRAYVKTVCRFACKESGRSAAIQAELRR